MPTYVVLAMAIAFFVAMYGSDGFRGRTNELWEKYVLPALRLGWPYALIYALYDTISSGSLGRTMRMIVSGN